jgi:hypothetical protein
VQSVEDWEGALRPACAALWLLLLLLVLLVLLEQRELAIIGVYVHEVCGVHQERAWVLCG